MAETKKSRNCLVPAIIAVIVILGVGVLAAFNIYHFVAARNQERVESHREENRRALEKIAAIEGNATTVDLAEDAMPDYSGFQSGDRLTPELYLAWKFDREATSLARTVFAERANGSLIRWNLQAKDLMLEVDSVSGIFQLNYRLAPRGGGDSRRGAMTVIGRFKDGERDPLLKVRRGSEVLIEGRLVVDGEALVIEDARLVGSKGEAE